MAGAEPGRARQGGERLAEPIGRPGEGVEVEPRAHPLLRLGQAAALHPQPPPDRALPEPRPHVPLGVEERRVARAGLRGEALGRAVLDDAAVLDDEHALEAQRLADVVGDAEQRRPLPEAAGPRQQLAPLLAVEAAERLVEERQAHPGAQQRARQAHPLPLAAGDQAAALAERRLQAVRQLAQDGHQVGGARSPGRAAGRGPPPRRSGGSRAASGSRAAPPDRPRRSRGAAPAAARRRAARRRPARGPRPAGASRGEPDQARLAGARGADDGDVLARRDRGVDAVEDRVPAGAHADVLPDDAGAGRGRRRQRRRRGGVRPASSASSGAPSGSSRRRATLRCEGYWVAIARISMCPRLRTLSAQ